MNVDDRSTSRRAFLAAGLGGVGLLALTRRGLSPLFALGEPAAADDDVLVVLQLSGGNDGLNTVVPFGHPEYHKARPRLAIAAKDALGIAPGLGLHPALKGLHELFGAGRLAIVQGVGYPNPNRSHFLSMDIWHAGDPEARDLQYGWLGRALDRIAAQKEPRPELGINLSEQVPLAMNGARYKPIAFESAAGYAFAGAPQQAKAFEKLSNAESGSGNPLLARLQRVARDAHASSREIRAKARAYRTTVTYPGGELAAALRQVAALLAGGLTTRVYYTYHGGFDTHVNQAGRHANLLRQLDQALVAFWQDLARLQMERRVTVLVFSEFGRRVRENGSAGTDHGVAAPCLVLGGRVRGGLHGEHPSLTELDQGDLVHRVDFRRVYASLCERVLRVDAGEVLGRGFEPLGLLG